MGGRENFAVMGAPYFFIFTIMLYFSTSVYDIYIVYEVD